MISKVKVIISKIRITKIILIFFKLIISALAYLAVGFSARNPQLVESYYSKGFYPNVARTFSWISNLIPFSLWDIFWIAVILLIITGVVLVAFRRAKLSWLILRIAQSMAILYTLFYIVWGFNYFRPKLEIRIGWEKPKTDETVFRSILDSMILHTNSGYVQILPSDYQEIDLLIEESYHKNCKT